MDKKILEYYVNERGEAPFIKWFAKLDSRSGIIVTKYIDRMAEGGSTNNIKVLKDGVYELRIFYGAGLRVYFANEGDKSGQSSDIVKAKKYWSDYAKKK